MSPLVIYNAYMHGVIRDGIAIPAPVLPMIFHSNTNPVENPVFSSISSPEAPFTNTA